MDTAMNLATVEAIAYADTALSSLFWMVIVMAVIVAWGWERG